MTPLPEVIAPASWHAVDFISDLHLHEADPDTFAAWQQYLQTTPANAVFMLGDVFDVWVGDDALLDVAGAASKSGFEVRCAEVLNQASQRLRLYFLPGNRDFLVGVPVQTTEGPAPSLMATGGLTLLADPTVLVFGDQRWLLSHGDALCLADSDYLAFRAKVRSAAWQRDFLSRPLAGRRDIAKELRAQSQAQNAHRIRAALPWADVDSAAARMALAAARSFTLIHGHTHRPALHELGAGCQRVVLSDWDFSPQAQPTRGDVLRLTRDGTCQRVEVSELD
jgi:UDP-2,3-diacylglucosamine hydrolase